MRTYVVQSNVYLKLKCTYLCPNKFVPVLYVDSCTIFAVTYFHIKNKERCRILINQNLIYHTLHLFSLKKLISS